MLVAWHRRLSYALVIAACLWLTFIISILLYQSTLFNENYESLNLISNDEMTFHMIVNGQRLALSEGRFADFFSQTHAAYGNVYWSFLALVTWPLYQLGLHSWVIAVPKLVSLGSLVACLVFMYLICRARRHSVLNSLLALCLAAPSSAAFFTALNFQTNLPVAALVMASLYLLVSNRFRNSLYWAAVFFGLAVGVKFTAILFVPLVLLFAEWNWKRLSVAIAIASGTAIVSYCPALFAYPFGVHSAEGSFAEFFEILRFNSQVRDVTRPFWTLISEGFFVWNYRPWIFIAGALATLISLYRSPSRMSFVFAGSVLAITAMASALKNEPLYLCFYTLPVLYLIPIIFLEMRLPSLVVTATLMGLCWYNYSVNGHYIRGNLFWVDIVHTSEVTKHKREIYQDLKAKVTVHQTDRVLVYAWLAFPADPLTQARHTSYYWTDDSPTIWSNHNLFAFYKDAPGWSEACSKTHFNASNCFFSQKIADTKSPFEVVYNTNDTLIIRVRRPLW